MILDYFDYIFEMYFLIRVLIFWQNLWNEFGKKDIIFLILKTVYLEKMNEKEINLNWNWIWMVCEDNNKEKREKLKKHENERKQKKMIKKWKGFPFFLYIRCGKLGFINRWFFLFSVNEKREKNYSFYTF